MSAGRSAALLLLASPLLGACGPSAASEELKLNVYAASSLTDVFDDLGDLFEAHHPGVRVALTSAGSQILRLQIEQGAPADVFASADPEHLAALADAGRVVGTSHFARTDLVVIVPEDDPASIEDFRQLPRARRIVIGSENVPVGRYTRIMLRRADEASDHEFEAKVMARVVSEETNVRLARAKVELGEADAAVVYRTDALGSSRVRIVEIPPEVNVRADYVIGVVSAPGDGTARTGRVGGPTRDDLAEAWIALLRSAEGRTVLARHGFLVE